MNKEQKALSKRAASILGDLSQWSKQCHMASLALIKAGVGDRVARGTCLGVGVHQHSWAVIGMDCYDKTATIIDPVLWSYRNDVRGIWIGSLADGLHKPHGQGSIWDWGRPPNATDRAISLTPKKRLSRQAAYFLEMLGPLDWLGWATLVKAPVLGWPAGEILAAIDDTKRLSALVPIDLLGMLTDRNPKGLYIRSNGKEPKP